MSEERTPAPPPSAPDGEGVRVIRKARTARRSALPWVLVVVALFGVALAWRLWPTHSTVAVAAAATPAPRAPEAKAAPVRHASSDRPAAEADIEAPSDGDPNDLANYFRPGDPEPTGAELIGALNDVGIHTGIGAFNPPGTSPPLEGLAVPEDFDLPEGYARHGQWTDEGVAIEPILMFSPDFQLFDAQGQPVAMPGNRVVPPHLAPPGLPLRRVRIPPP